MKSGGSRHWSVNEIWYLKKNWHKISNIKIGEKLNRSARAVSFEGVKFNLNNDNRGTEEDVSYRNFAYEDYHRYTEMCELDARMKEFRSSFNISGIHKFIVNGFDLKGNRVKDERKINGKVVSTTENIVTLQLAHYKESFTVNSFFTGEISIRS